MGLTLHQPGHNHSHGGSPSYSPTASGHQSQTEDNSTERDDKHLLDDKQKLVEYGSISNQNVPDVEKNDHGHSHKKEKNINVRAAFIHVLGDLVQSLGVLVAAVIIWFKVGLIWICNGGKKGGICKSKTRLYFQRGFLYKIDWQLHFFSLFHNIKLRYE